MSLDSLIDITIITFTLIMAAVPIIKDATNKEVTGNLFIKLTWAGWTLIGCAFVIIGFTYWKDTRTDDQKKQDKIFSLNQHTGDSSRLANIEKRVGDLGYIYNKKTDKFENFISSKFDSASKFKNKLPFNNKSTNDETPILDLAIFDNQTSNPVIQKTGAGMKCSITYKVQTVGKEIAYYPKTYLNLFSLNKSFIDKESGHYDNSANESTLIGPNIYIEFKSNCIFYKVDSNDTTYLYLKIIFKNKVGKLQNPFRKIFFYTSQYLNKSLPEVNDDKFNFIKSRLIKQKLW